MRVEGHGPDDPVVGPDGEGRVPARLQLRRLPEPHGPVVAGRGDQTAAGPERDGADAAGMPAQHEGLPPGRRVPEPDEPIETGRGDPGAVRAARHAAGRVVVAVHLPGGPPGPRVPGPQGAVLVRDDEQAPAAGEHHAPRRVGPEALEGSSNTLSQLAASRSWTSPSSLAEAMSRPSGL